MKKIVIFLFLIISNFSFAQTTGIFESYIIINSGSGNIYYDAHINTGNPDFDGEFLGSFTSADTFILNGGEVKTWQNSGDYIIDTFINYKLYKVGSTPPANFSTTQLPFNSDLPNSGDKKWDKLDASINLLSGLPAGNYTIEIYFHATTNYGNDRYSNNGGSNYIANFTVTSGESILNGIVTVTPSPPKRTEQVIINLDATGTDLESATKVYLHSGVATDAPSSTSFNKTVGNWGLDDGIGEMTNIGANEWEITLTSIDAYYALTTNDDAFALNFLFRDETGANKEDNSGSNYHLDIDSGNYFLISNPSYNPFLVETLVNFDIEASANTSADWTLIELDENDVVINTNVNSATTQNYSFTHSLSDIGVTHYYELQVDFGTETKSKFFEVVAYGSIVDEVMPVGAEKGINYNFPTANEVTLVLHTPTSTTYTYYDSSNCSNTSTANTAAKEVVHLIGDFNNWEINSSYQLKRDGDFWWITLDTSTLTEDEYVYQYLIDGNVRIGDPYANKISDPDDQYISASVYPDLIAYPTGETSGRASVLELNKTPYSWQVSSFSRPVTSNNLNVYELHFRDFTAEGTYKAATAKLDYIKAMGINCIHVMPVSEFEGNNSWGYNPNYYFAADKAYGTANDLKEFIDEAHQRGIAVVNDLVLNHAFYSNPMAQLYWNDTLNRPANDSPYFNPEHKGIYDSAGHWGADWNHGSEHTRNMVDDILDYWITEFKFDGFRFDFTKGFTQADQDSGDPWASSYDNCRVEILQRMVNEMWTSHPGTYAIFEHLADDAEDKALADYGMLMWSGAGPQDSWLEMAMGTTIESFWSSTADSRSFIFSNYMSYMESHDEERVGYKVITWGADNDGSDSYISNRTKLPAAFSLLLPGPRMVWQFGELGYDVSIDQNGRTGDKPSAWELNYDQNTERQEIYNFYSHLFNFRNKYDLYYAKTDATLAEIDYGNINSTTEWVRRMSLADATNNGVHAQTQVIAIGNFDTNTDEIVSPGYKFTGEWYKYNGDPTVDGTKFTVSATTDQFNLYTTDPVYILSNADIISPELTPKNFTVDSSSSCNYLIPADDTQYDVTSEVWVGGTAPTEGHASDNGTIVDLYYSELNGTSTTGKPTSLAGVTLDIGTNNIVWTVVDSFGNETSNEQTITITTSAASPTVAVQEVTPIESGTSTTVNVDTPDANYTYHWYAAQNDVTELANGTSYATGNLTETTSFWVEAIENGTLCKSNRIEVVVEISSGLNTDNYDLLRFVTYPNPTKGKLHITIPQSINVQTGTIEIFTILGQKVLSKPVKVVNGIIELSIDNLSNSLYIANIILDKKYSVKIIKN